MRREFIASVGLAVVVACGPAPAPTAPASASRPSDRDGFAEMEDDILRHISALDARFARRAHVTPSEEDLQRVAMSAVISGDESVAVIEGVIDPFSFDARARGLDVVRHELARWPADQARPSERQLLGDVVTSELARLDEERELPRSASSLVRAIADGWRPPKSERATADADRWLARRLAQVRTALEASADPSSSLDVVRARELDDVLDTLERVAQGPGFAAATSELVRVRDALETASSRPASKARSEWTRTARRIQAHLGLEMRDEDLSRELGALESDLRARAERAGFVPWRAGIASSAGVTKIDDRMLVSGPCIDAVPGSRVRSLAAPPEREPSCHLRHFVAENDEGSPVVLAILHDHVVVAEWALDIARGSATVAAAEGKHGLLALPAPETRARYERTALARPVASIAAGLTVKILMAGNPRQRAAAWSTLGDVPLDIAARELGAP